MLDLELTERRPMTVAPHILRQVRGEPVSADTPPGSQAAFSVTSEAFQPIDLGRPICRTRALAMFEQAANMALGGDRGVALLVLDCES